MKKITLAGCDILIGKDLIDQIVSLYQLDNYSKIFVVTDEKVQPLFLPQLLNVLNKSTESIILPPGEAVKNIVSIQQIWTAMYQTKCDRKSLVINLGGGVIGDMGGFAASTYMRGISFLNIPTTLLAQVDASIGGKTGIDFCGIKNLIGTINQPVGVLIDTQTLVTLPKRELISGFAEIIKHGLIKDQPYFEQVTAKKPVDFSPEEMVEIIYNSGQIKADIVESDSTENGERKILNFGHTVGHAIEALSLETATPLLHGEAISVGMLAEAKISELNGLINQDDFKIIDRALRQAELPTQVTGINTKDILEKMTSDKKNEKGIINLTLLIGIGSAVYNQNISQNLIEDALKVVLS